MIGQRLLRIGSLLLGSPVSNAVAVTRAAVADEADEAMLVGWVQEEAEKRGITITAEYALRICRLAARKGRSHQHSRMAILAVHFNPAGYRTPRDNYLRFLHHIRSFGLPVFSAEVAFDGQDFPTSDAYLQIRGSAQNVMWQKERLVNLLSESVPDQYDCLAWIDSDLMFLDPAWPKKAMEALGESPVVQLWSQCHGVNAEGRVYETLTCVGPGAHRYLNNERQCPGGAWAARRNVFPIYDAHIVGSGDATTVEGWTNLANPKCMAKMNNAMRAHLQEWASDAYRKVRGRIGVLTGDITHMHHGHRKHRRYVERWEPLVRGGFDPASHLRIDDNGLYAWTRQAPHGLRRHVLEYFMGRREDD